jgi:hypothetical protein
MKRMRPQRRRAGLMLGATLCLLATTSAATSLGADSGALQRCRAISEAAARLACYDALPLAPLSTLAPPAPAPAAVPPVPPAAAPAVVQSFGQERRDEPEAIASHIQGVFEGWGPRSRITLANGQVWQVVDGSEGVYFLQNPKVTVKRALMGGFLLDIEGAKRTPRVRRVE